MITKLNLATKPFRNRTLPYLLAMLLLTISVVGALFAFSTLNDIRAKNEIVKVDIETMREENAKLGDKSKELQKELTPAQQQLLIASHKLVANKAFGWSRLFADIERVLPGDVSASRISVQRVFKDQNKIKAELEFSVLSRGYPSVDQMIQRMNNSGIFKAELRGQDLRKAETITYEEYTLFLIYTQNYIYAAPTETVDEPEDRPAMLDNIKAQKGGAE